jgi:hypothetical protein
MSKLFPVVACSTLPSDDAMFVWLKRILKSAC